MKAKSQNQCKWKPFISNFLSFFVILSVSLSYPSTYSQIDPELRSPTDSPLSSQEKQLIKSAFNNSFPVFQLTEEGKVDAPQNNSTRLLIMAYYGKSQVQVQSAINKILEISKNPDIKIYRSEIIDLTAALKMEAINYRLKEIQSSYNTEKNINQNLARQLKPYKKKLSDQRFAAFLGVPLASFLALYTSGNFDVMAFTLAAEIYYMNAIGKSKAIITNITQQAEELLDKHIRTREQVQNHLLDFVRSIEEALEESKPKKVRCGGVL
jgi:hypothetical protein